MFAVEDVFFGVDNEGRFRAGRGEVFWEVRENVVTGSGRVLKFWFIEISHEAAGETASDFEEFSDVFGFVF